MTVTHDAKPIPEPTTKNRVRRTADQLVADLEARIASIKARAERKKTRGNPAVRHTVAAVRSMDKAAASTGDAPLRKSLEEARGALAAWLLLNGIAIPAARVRRSAAARCDAMPPPSETSRTGRRRRKATV